MQIDDVTDITLSAARKAFRNFRLVASRFVYVFQKFGFSIFVIWRKILIIRFSANLKVHKSLKNYSWYHLKHRVMSEDEKAGGSSGNY